MWESMAGLGLRTDAIYKGYLGYRSLLSSVAFEQSEARYSKQLLLSYLK